MTQFCGPDVGGRIEWPDMSPRDECWVKVKFENRCVQNHAREGDGHFVMWLFKDRMRAPYAFRVEDGWYIDYLSDGTPDGDTMFNKKYRILSLWGPFDTMKEAYNFKIDNHQTSQ